MTLKIKKLDKDALLPSYKSGGASGFDISSLKDYVVKAKRSELVQTGFAMSIVRGYELQIRPRSGLALKHGISILNSPGTIDSDYRGEIKILLINTSDEDFQVKKGDRIAQGVIAPIISADIIEVEELEDSERGSGGFGSTGV